MRHSLGDAARLSAYQHKHINVHGHYSFALPDLDGGRRPLRDSDTADEQASRHLSSLRRRARVTLTSVAAVLSGSVAVGDTAGLG